MPAHPVPSILDSSLVLVEVTSIPDTVSATRKVTFYSRLTQPMMRQSRPLGVDQGKSSYFNIGAAQGLWVRDESLSIYRRKWRSSRRKAAGLRRDDRFTILMAGRK
jgi:hypothetical protein